MRISNHLVGSENLFTNKHTISRSWIVKYTVQSYNLDKNNQNYTIKQSKRNRFVWDTFNLKTLLVKTFKFSVIGKLDNFHEKLMIWECDFTTGEH